MKSLLILALLFVGTLASAANGKPYGDAGCGLGSLLFKENDNTSQVLAATTNGSTYTNLFGISSGTSNCVDNGSVKASKAVPAFIEVNKTALAEDSARGQGETLAGLANLLGCKSENFGSAMKANYQHIFVDSKMNASAIESNINSVISQNKTVACGA